MAAHPHPSVSRIAAVARALREVAADVVFIGGAIAPLLQTRSPLPKVRATLDVDAVVASTMYSEFSTLAERLQALGFSRDVADTSHVHRWRAPVGIPFDLVPAGGHLGGTGSSCDRLAIETAVEAEIEPGLTIRHASAPGFLALKWAAFHDRGADDPFLSHDLEDILALIVSRDALADEVLAAPPGIQDEIRRGFRWLVASPDYDDLVAASLGAAPQFRQIAAMLRDRVDSMLG